MNREPVFSFVDVDDSKGLLVYYPAIEKLFASAFGQPLSCAMWDWAYQNNPFGSPLVSLAFHESELIGHYAVIPMNLDSKDRTLSGYLSMTTMVSSNYRGHNLFKELATRVYSRIESRGIESVVFGFPNDQSAPGFKKRLGWTVSEDFHVVALKEENLEDVRDLLLHSDEASYYLDLDNPKISAWRTNKPNQEWEISEGIGIKKFSTELDLMFLRKGVIPNSLPIESTLNSILPVSKKQAENLDLKISFPYHFGYRTFNMIDEPKFNVQMCMSDVF